MASNRNYQAMEALVEELVGSGVRHACVSPGNRSAPLAFALARNAGIEVFTHIDERAGAFFALGLARATRWPVAVACTSGTAAANFLPAVVEAHHARVPLVVLTADRPPELRERSAGQTIDQLGLYGSHARWSFDLGVPEPDDAGVRHVRAAVCRAVSVAAGPPAGVAHLNLPMRDPLDPAQEEGWVPETDPAKPGAHTMVHVGASRAAVEELGPICERLDAAQRPILQCGPFDARDEGLCDAVAELADRLDAPVLAEPTSNLRRGRLLGRMVHGYEALVRAGAACTRTPPDVIVRIGGPPTSRTIATWLDTSAADLIVLDESDGWPDPTARARHIVQGATASSCRALADGVRRSSAEGSWTETWKAADRTACGALADALAGEDAPFEGHVVRAIAEVLPEGAGFYVGNSLAVRDLDWFWPADGPAVRVLANRGANGIDGFVSSVLGAAASGRRVLGLCGDLSFFHDISGLAGAHRLGVSACFVVPNNGGGGIFDYLPSARAGEGYAEHFEEMFVTPLGLDLGPLVEGYGASFQRIDTVTSLRPAIERAWDGAGVHVVEVMVDRAHSQAAHGRAWAQVQRALRGGE